MSTDSKDLIISYLNGKMNLIFDMNSGSRSGLVNLSVSLYPSQVKLFRGKALIGKVESINDPYELLSFRIENDSSTHTLMRPNLYMEGHIVLTVGLLDHSTNDIYYLQQIVDDLNFTQMLSDAENSYATNNVSSQYLIDLEKDYFRLKSHNSRSDATEQVVITGTVNKDQTQLNQSDSNSGSIRTTSLLYKVPDSIFKSGSFNKWFSYKNTAAPAYCYSYITYNFAGTNNRLTYIVFIDIPVDNDFSYQEFSLQLTVRDNVSVLYNVYDDSLCLFGDDNRIKINNINLKHNSNTINGVFNKRYYTGVKTGSPIGNIIRAIITWVPYASQALSSYEYLTSSSETCTNQWYAYHTTAELQRDANNGKIVDEITAEYSGLKQNNDYFLLITRGNAINSITWSYTYTPYYS